MIQCATSVTPISEAPTLTPALVYNCKTGTGSSSNLQKNVVLGNLHGQALHFFAYGSQFTNPFKPTSCVYRNSGVDHFSVSQKRFYNNTRQLNSIKERSCSKFSSSKVVEMRQLLYHYCPLVCPRRRSFWLYLQHQESSRKHSTSLCVVAGRPS